MWDLVQQIELLDGNLINLVQDVDAGHVYPVAFDDAEEGEDHSQSMLVDARRCEVRPSHSLNKIVDCTITSEGDIGTGDLVLVANSLDDIGVDLRQRDSLHCGNFHRVNVYRCDIA